MQHALNALMESLKSDYQTFEPKAAEHISGLNICYSDGVEIKVDYSKT